MQSWKSRLPHHYVWITLTLAGGVCAVASSSIVSAQAPDHEARAVVIALRVTQAPVIDGRLSEEAWTRASAASTFTQRDPDEGKPSTERTALRVLYDDA